MKSHIVICLEPLPLDEKTVGLCGAEIAHPSPVMWVDLNERPLPEWNSLLDCARCFRLAESESMAGFRERAEKSSRVYLYIVSEAQEALAEQYRGDCIEGLVETVEKAEGPGE